MRNSNPSLERPYLADPNYFRLGYQLAAQMLNLEKAGKTKGPVIEKAADILYGEPVWPEKHAARLDARERANEFIEDANEMLEWYAGLDKRKRRWELWRDKVRASEERLDEFLRRTVEPCLTIVVAASYQPNEPEIAEGHLAMLRERVKESEDPETGEKDVSYRVFYNLACYEAGNREGNVVQAIHYLRLALNRAPEMRRREVGHWARKDPSLKPLHDEPEYEELLKPYAPATKQAGD